MTQPALWRENLTQAEKDVLWLGGVGDVQRETGEEYYSARVLGEAMIKFNNVLLEVCDARKVECIDLANLIPRHPTMFFDDVHFAESGSHAVAVEISKYLRQNPLWDTL